ncbi:MAG: hypothetical protein E3J72_14355 [Planctomycetota bacterium]|nr:MAG: hypothetical protein E3J72_14355 [Planctomycetota bacterium]
MPRLRTYKRNLKPLDKYKEKGYPRATRLFEELVSFLPNPVTMRPAFEDALDRFIKLFRIGKYRIHYISRAILVECTDKRRIYEPDHPVKRSHGEDYLTRMSKSKLLRHLLQGRNLNPKHVIWLHPSALPRTDRFVIDIDAKHPSELKRAKEVLRTVVRALGKPEFTVKSRGGLGFNLWYFLESQQKAKMIRCWVRSILADCDLWEKAGRSSDYELFPKELGTALPAIPFGVNSFPCDERGLPDKIPSELALLKWRREVKERDGIRTVDVNKLKKSGEKHKAELLANTTGRRRQVLLRQYLESPRPSIAPIEEGRGQGKRKQIAAVRSRETPQWWPEDYSFDELKKKVSILLDIGLTRYGQRRVVQNMLKIYSRGILKMDGEQAFQWVWANFQLIHNDKSKDYNKSPDTVREEIHKFCLDDRFTTPRRRGSRSVRNVNSPKISSHDFTNIIKYIRQKRRVINTASSAAGIRYANKFRKGLLSFMVHAFGHARANGKADKKGFLTVEMRRDEMKQWEFCSRDYNRYLRFLKKARWISMKPQKRFTIRFYTIRQRPEGCAQKFKFSSMCKCLLDDVGPLFFGTGWKRFKRS